MSKRILLGFVGVLAVGAVFAGVPKGISVTLKWSSATGHTEPNITTPCVIGNVSGVYKLAFRTLPPGGVTITLPIGRSFAGQQLLSIPSKYDFLAPPEGGINCVYKQAYCVTASGVKNSLPCEPGSYKEMVPQNGSCTFSNAALGGGVSINNKTQSISLTCSSSNTPEVKVRQP
jgi:hypothetical protein